MVVSLIMNVFQMIIPTSIITFFLIIILFGLDEVFTKKDYITKKKLLMNKEFKELQIRRENQKLNVESMDIDSHLF